MISQLLLGLLADVVFESVATIRRSFSAEMDGYLEKRGLVKDRAVQRPAVR